MSSTSSAQKRKHDSSQEETPVPVKKNVQESDLSSPPMAPVEGKRRTNIISMCEEYKLGKKECMQVINFFSELEPENYKRYIVEDGQCDIEKGCEEICQMLISYGYLVAYDENGDEVFHHLESSSHEKMLCFLDSLLSHKLCGCESYVYGSKEFFCKTCLNAFCSQCAEDLNVSIDPKTNEIKCDDSHLL